MPCGKPRHGHCCPEGPSGFHDCPPHSGPPYRFLHGTLNDAAIALAIPFIFNLIRFVNRRLALYDILELGMVGVIMGWPFGLIATAASKALHALIHDTWGLKLLGRRRGEGVYAFPYSPKKEKAPGKPRTF